MDSVELQGSRLRESGILDVNPISNPLTQLQYLHFSSHPKGVFKGSLAALSITNDVILLRRGQPSTLAIWCTKCMCLIT